MSSLTVFVKGRRNPLIYYVHIIFPAFFENVETKKLSELSRACLDCRHAYIEIGV